MVAEGLMAYLTPWTAPCRCASMSDGRMEAAYSVRKWGVVGMRRGLSKVALVTTIAQHGRILTQAGSATPL